MKELASLHDQHLNRPTLDDSSEQEHAIEITAQEITQVRVGLGPQAGVGSSRPPQRPERGTALRSHLPPPELRFPARSPPRDLRPRAPPGYQPVS